MTWEAAQEAWAKAKLGRDDVVITYVEFETTGGGDVQIGDMTWDYEQADIYAVVHFTIIDDPSGWGSHSRSFQIDSFGGLLAEIIAAAP